jgi:putative membrane protein
MFLVRLVINFVALLAVFILVWNVHGTDALVTAVGMTVIMAVVNAFLRPVVILSTLGTSILTLGVFGILVNLLLFTSPPWWWASTCPSGRRHWDGRSSRSSPRR